MPVSRKAAPAPFQTLLVAGRSKHAKSGNDRILQKAVGIAKTLDQVFVIHAVHYDMLFL